MQTVNITVASGAIFKMNPKDFEVMEAKPSSIAKGKCFVRIKENDFHFEISKKEFSRLAEALDMHEVAHG